MSRSGHTSTSSTWVLRSILWVVASCIVLSLIYKLAFRKVVEQRLDCLDRATAAQRANSPLTAVDGYATCIGKGGVVNLSGASSAHVPAPAPAAGITRGAPGNTDTRPTRCRYAGVWAATRGTVVYILTLEADGRFTAEPGANTPPNAQTITGAWSTAGNTMAWVYDSGAVWPPDINPISAESMDAFTLTEVNGSKTRYTLMERYRSTECKG